MKKWRKVIPVIALALMSAAMTGCAGKNDIPSAPYFTKGVYYNYAKDAENPPLTYFYVFYDENTGYTADGENNGIGLPFSLTQEEGAATFSFGGEGESEVPAVLHDGVLRQYPSGGTAKHQARRYLHQTSDRDREG